MIAFGCSISDPEPYLRYAEPGLRLAAEPDSEIYAFASVGTLSRSHNLLLDAAAAREDLEALVLVHQHAEIADPDVCEKVRQSLRDQDVGVVGCVGARDVRNLAWWEGTVLSAPVVTRYQEYGGGEVGAFSWANPAPPPGEVEVVDGWLLVLSPWAVRNVRFDESLTFGYGFDMDYCLQVRAAGRKVMVQDIRVVYHRELELVESTAWIEGHVRIGEKWDGRMPGVDPAVHRDWKQRARRAEAERDAARAIASSHKHAYDARVRQSERALAEINHTISWRITAPLRKSNNRRRPAKTDA